MLYIIGITITFFLVFVLSSKKNKSQADKILVIWLFFTGLHLLIFYLYVSEKYLIFPYLLGLEIPMPLLQGPFLFLYTSALTNQVQRKKTLALHFIPYLAALLWLIPFYSLSFSQKIEVYQAEGKGYEYLTIPIFVATVISGLLYTIISLRALVNHRRRIVNQFSFTENINLKWLSYLIAGSSIIWFHVIFSDEEYIYSTVVLYVIFIGYFGIKQVGIFTNKEPQEDGRGWIDPSIEETGNAANIIGNELEIQKQLGKNKYEKSRIREEDLKAIHQKLTELMQNEKLFKDPELSLSDVAQKIEAHPNTLSQVINSLEQKNFFDYINHQRIDEFKRIVALPENYNFTLLSLAFECGFNSKTSFNRNFKKATDFSPTQYLKAANIHLK